MKKILIISSFIFSALLADSSLGTPILAPTLKPQYEIKSYNKNIENPPKAQSKQTQRNFRKDDHRYDKRYRNFDYDRDGYYDDDGYYYGYYDTTGYFYNNIFFTFNSQYTYYDRVHLRGHFQPHYRQHRVYEYHVINDWNRVHCYREPNSIIYGHYYDRPSYRNSYRSSYYNNGSSRYYNNHRYSHNNARMYTNTNQNSYRRENNQREHHYRNDNHRYNNHNSYRNRNERRSDTRMRTRNSSNSHRTTTHQNHNYGNKSNQHSTAHMQLSR